MNKYPFISEVKLPIPSESEKKVRIKGPHKKPVVKETPVKGINMNEVTINLPSLVDLALGHPEVCENLILIFIGIDDSISRLKCRWVLLILILYNV